MSDLVSSRLSSIQALRGFAALGVVLLHIAGLQVEEGLRSTAGWSRFGWVGVDLFFIISGFLMVWVTDGFGQGRDVAIKFIGKRLVRIYPLWFVCVTLLAIFFVIVHGVPAHPDNVPRESAWAHYFLSLILFPHNEAPLLVVGWTLVHEMFFYSVFGLIILIGLRQNLWSAMLGWAFITAVGIHWNWDTVSPALSVIFNSLSFYFIAGMLTAQIFLGQSRNRYGVLSIVTGALIVLALVFTDTIDKSDRVLQLILPLSLILYGSLTLERNIERKIPFWMMWLGDVSYSLYLTHLLTIIGWRVVLKPFYPGGLLENIGAVLPDPVLITLDTVSLLICCLIVAQVFHLFIELAALRYLRTLLLR